MSEKRSIVRPLISALLVGATIAGLINVFGDHTEVMAMAKQTACPTEGCSADMTRIERSPFGQSYTFQTSTGQPGSGRSVDVDCRREYWLVGTYNCKRSGD